MISKFNGAAGDIFTQMRFILFVKTIGAQVKTAQGAELFCKGIRKPVANIRNFIVRFSAVAEIAADKEQSTPVRTVRENRLRRANLPHIDRFASEFRSQTVFQELKAGSGTVDILFPIKLMYTLRNLLIH